MRVSPLTCGGMTMGVAPKMARAEGVEQGDSLAPALFALGLHDALIAAAQQLQAG